MDGTITVTGSQIFFMAVAAGAGFACGYVPVRMLLEWGLTRPVRLPRWT